MSAFTLLLLLHVLSALVQVFMLSLSVVVLLLSFSLLNFSNSLQTTLYNTRGSLYTRSILLFDRWRHLIKY